MNECQHPGQCIETINTSDNVLNMCIYENDGARFVSILTDMDAMPIEDNVVSCPIDSDQEPSVLSQLLVKDLVSLHDFPQMPLDSETIQTSHLLHLKLKAFRSALGTGVYQQEDGSVLVILPGLEWTVRADTTEPYFRACMLFNALVQVGAHDIDTLDLQQVREVCSSSTARCYKCKVVAHPMDSVPCSNSGCVLSRHRCCVGGSSGGGQYRNQECPTCLYQRMFSFIEPSIGTIFSKSLSKVAKKQRTASEDWIESVKMLRPQLNIGDEIKVKDQVHVVEGVKPLCYDSKEIQWDCEQKQYVGNLSICVRQEQTQQPQQQWSEPVPIQFFQ